MIGGLHPRAIVRGTPPTSDNPSVRVHYVTLEDPDARDGWYEDYPSQENSHRCSRPEERVANYSLLRVNQAVRAKALQVSWAHFKTTAMFHKVLCFRSHSFGPTWLSKIELKFDLLQWFEFFGVNIGLPGSATRLAGYLKRIPALKRLSLVFPSPSKAWMTLPNSFPLLFLLWNEEREISRKILRMEDHACYRGVIDWLLCVAFPFVTCIPKVTLNGYVKADQKEKWERIIRTEYRQGDQVSRTHGYVHSEAMNAIRSYSVDNPPTCSCPLPCSKSKLRAMNHWQYLDGVFDCKDEFSPELHQRAVRVLDEVYASRRIYQDYLDVCEKLEVVGPAANLEYYEAKYTAAKEIVREMDEV
jgi:hypothetical protein